MLPVMLDVKGKKCTVIGGGCAAWRKAKTLVDNGADVTVISETLCEKFDGMDIRYIKKPYSDGDTKNSFLVVAATNDKDLNRRIKADAENGDTKLFLSADGESSDLMFMAYAQSGDTKIAVSTNGAYPMLGARVCEKLTPLCKKCDWQSEILSEFRKRILESSVDSEKRHELLSLLVEDEMLEINDTDTFRKKAENIVEEYLF